MIRLENVSKSYRIRQASEGTGYQRLLARVRSLTAPRYHEVLRNVSIEILPGESVALLGINGCGKTTLLRLVCGISRPTSGKISVIGRAGGLVELTAGFHDDLNGLENIFLNGTLLGMSRAEIRSRLDAILDFAELGDFIHTPIKHYSWGMLLRLGFAIAVHADLDIFVVDEALAVGDGYFQWKCLQKIEALKQEGKTLLFVSHAPAMAEAVCQRALWLHDGQVQADGPSGDVAKAYMDFVAHRLVGETPKDLPVDLVALVPRLRFGTGAALIREVRLADTSGTTRHTFTRGESAVLELRVEVRQPIRNLTAAFQMDLPNRTVLKAYSHHVIGYLNVEPGMYTIRIKIPELRLYEGTYYLTVGLLTPEPLCVYDGLVHMYTFAVKSDGRRFSERALDTGAQVTWESSHSFS
jgi:ABC-type polysaccharide/polyol phosphate transport system ATPase subunit